MKFKCIDCNEAEIEIIDPMEGDEHEVVCDECEEKDARRRQVAQMEKDGFVGRK